MQLNNIPLILLGAILFAHSFYYIQRLRKSRIIKEVPCGNPNCDRIIPEYLAYCSMHCSDVIDSELYK